MPTSQHQSTKYDFPRGMPCTAEAITLVRKTNAESNASIRRYNFEDDAEDRECHGVFLIAVCLDPDNEDHADNDEPEIMSQLSLNLFTDEVHPCSPNRIGAVKVVFSLFISKIMSIYAKGPLFVHVGVPHRDNDGESRDVHHHNI